MAALEGAVNPRPITCCYGQGGSFAYHYLLISLIELSAPPPPPSSPPPPPLLSAPFYLLSLMENDADTSRPAMPRQPSGDQLGFSFDEPHFAPIIPNILIIEPSTPDRSDSSRNSTEERGYGFVDLVPPEEDKVSPSYNFSLHRFYVQQEKAPEPEKDKKEEHHEGEIVEDMTVSSSPLNERHAIRTVAQMTPTNVDDVPIKEVGLFLKRDLKGGFVIIIRVGSPLIRVF